MTTKERLKEHIFPEKRFLEEIIPSGKDFAGFTSMLSDIDFEYPDPQTNKPIKLPKNSKDRYTYYFHATMSGHAVTGRGRREEREERYTYIYPAWRIKEIFNIKGYIDNICHDQDKFIITTTRKDR